MSETQLTVIAALAAVVFVAAGVLVARHHTQDPQGWAVPAAIGAAFAAWSVYAVIDGGPFGFWPEHISNAWEVQIWFDLLLAVGAAWYLLQPRLRHHGIAPLPWFALVVATGSIGLLAVLTRLLYAERSAARTHAIARLDGGSAHPL